MTTTTYRIPVLHGSNERAVYEFGNEFGFVGYVLAEDFSDAYELMLDSEADRGNVCDHGGEITDEQRWNQYAGDATHDDFYCDCQPDSQGRWVWDVYLWVKRLSLTVDNFYLAFPEEN